MATPNVVDNQTNEVLVTLLLDRSGSMESCRQTTIDGCNEYLNGLKKDSETKYSVNLYQFDTQGTSPEFTVTCEEKALADVAPLTLESFVPRGMTPLFDAIGETCRRIQAKGRGVILVIVTDGMNNASAEFTLESARALLKQKEEAEKWQVLFLGADINAMELGSMLGRDVSKTASYTKGMESQMWNNVAASTMRYASASRTYGVGSEFASSAMNFTEEERRSMYTGSSHQAPPPSNTGSGHTVENLGNTGSSTWGGRPAASSTFQRLWNTKPAPDSK